MTDQAPGTTADREVAITRVFDAPREVVFTAWTDPDRVARWWGPEGCDIPPDKVNIDPHVGGPYDTVMVLRDPEIAAGIGLEVGTEFPDRSVVIELEEPELLVLESEAQPEIGLPVPTITRIEFHDDGDGRTRVEITSGPHTAEMAPDAELGWEGSLDKLEEILAAAV